MTQCPVAEPRGNWAKVGGEDGWERGPRGKKDDIKKKPHTDTHNSAEIKIVAHLQIRARTHLSQCKRGASSDHGCKDET